MSLTATQSDPPRQAAPEARRRGRVRVAFCIDNMGPGGTESNAVRTAELLDRERFELTVVTMRDAGIMRARYAAAGVPVVAYPLTSLAAPSTARQALRLAAFLRAERFDIVHSHDRYNNIFATVAARLARVPVVIGSKRWSVSPRGFQTANAAAFRLVHRVLANSETVAESLRRVERVSARRIVVVPNFVNDAAFEDARPGERERILGELGVPAGAPVVGILARLRPIKDHESLFQAAAMLRARHPALRVLLVGDGELQDQLAARARALGVEGMVVFAGHREHSPNPHRLFDVSVLCSLSEGFPNSVVEAMAAERPVVATRVGGVPDAVVDGETGLLVSPRAPAELAAAIGALLDDPARRARMGAAGRARAHAQFHASRVVPQLERLYERLLAERAG